ncbi:MAG: hypothetical protein ACYDCJ_03915 [Gammaproteobacteria bacterium]
MKNVIVLASLLMMLQAKNAAAAPPIPVTAARVVFAHAHALCGADRGRLWGISLCGPLMLADPRTGAAITNVPVVGAKRSGAYYRLTLAPSEPIADAPFEYEGIRFAQVIWPPSGSADQQSVDLMHESFHRIQPQLGFVVHGVSNADTMISGDPALDTETGRIWLRGEIHALHVALTSTGAVRKKALSDALEMRAYRHAMLPSTVAPEHELDIMEGLAESTGIDVGLPASRRMAYTLHDMKFVESAPSYARTFFFAIGPAYSALLDAVKPNWRRTVTMKTSITALAARAYGISMVTPSPEVAQAMLARYGGTAIERQEAARAARQAARDATLRAELVAGKTLRLPLKQFKISFNPSNLDRLGRYGSVYHRVMLSAAWGRIDVSHGDALINPNFSVLIVAAPPVLSGQTLHGHGWVLTLSSGTRVVADPTKPGSYTVTFHHSAAR